MHNIMFNLQLMKQCIWKYLRVTYTYMTLGVDGVDPVNNIILYIIILYSYIIHCEP